MRDTLSNSLVITIVAASATTLLGLAIASLDFFTNTNAAAGLIRQGVPVEIRVPASGAVAQFNAVAISKAAPHPNAARLFVEHALGKDAQKDLSDNTAYPVRKDVPPPGGLPLLTEVKLLTLDLSKAPKQREDILKWWQASTGFNIR